MFNLKSAFYDDMIPNWRMSPAALGSHILILVMHGKLIYSINQSKIAAEKGDFIFIPKGTFRSSENDGLTHHRKYTVLFDHSFPPGTVPLFDNDCFTKKRISNIDYVAKRFEALYREKQEEKPMYQFIVNGILQELMGIASREAGTSGISPSKWILAEKMQQHIRSHYRLPYNVNELAELIQRSPNYTISLFREVIGQTPVKYMLQLRIAEARNLLINTDYTVTEIADYLGFYDTSYFYKTFKKVTGLTPSAFTAQRVNVQVSDINNTSYPSLDRRIRLE